MRIHLDTDFGGDTDDACALAYLLGAADPAACAIALGRVPATIEETAVRLRADGGLDRNPTGHPVRLVTAVDGAAFAAQWLDTVAGVR